MVATTWRGFGVPWALRGQDGTHVGFLLVDVA